MDPELAKALEIIFILHLDHEQNASTSTVRTAGEHVPEALGFFRCHMLWPRAERVHLHRAHRR